MIFLIRHGQTEFNVHRRLQGRMDSPLTELGRQQARRMGEVLKAHMDDPGRWLVVSSPLGRTLATAKIVCETLGLGCAIETDQRLAEIDVGDWEGLCREEIEAERPGACSAEGWIFTAPRGETREEMAARLTAMLAEHDEADGRRRLFVAHGLSGTVLREIYARAGAEPAWPPQDAVFQLSGGAIQRVDPGADPNAEHWAGLARAPAGR